METDAELAALFALISRELAQAELGSLEWQGGMIPLDNIRREQAKCRVAMRPHARKNLRWAIVQTIGNMPMALSSQAGAH
jgi:hypothetical protein